MLGRMSNSAKSALDVEAGKTIIGHIYAVVCKRENCQKL